jgi:hypothetical protein
MYSNSAFSTLKASCFVKLPMKILHEEFEIQVGVCGIFQEDHTQ